MEIVVSTNRHLGDTLILSGALRNLREAIPEAEIWYRGDYGAVFENTPVHTDNYPEHPDYTLHVKATDFGQCERVHEGGNMVERQTRALAQYLGRDIPCEYPEPYVVLTAEEMAQAERYPACGGILINTNCQAGSTVKGYPYWGDVIRYLAELPHMRKYPLVLTGGREARDVRGSLGDLPARVVDIRGRTSIREFLALVYYSECVVSPPSSIVHAAAAFCGRAVVVSGAREPATLTTYANTRHLATICRGRRRYMYNSRYGCMHFHAARDGKSCEFPVEVGGRCYARCMAAIPPELIATTIQEML